MKRLTEKGVRYCEKENAEMHKEHLTHIYEFYEKIGKIENKLGKLEDLEEEIGCPLEVVFKALANGVYYEDVANCMKYMAVDLHLNSDGEYVLFFDDEEYLLTKNYKKTWWLKETREE